MNLIQHFKDLIEYKRNLKRLKALQHIEEKKFYEGEYEAYIKIQFAIDRCYREVCAYKDKYICYCKLLPRS